MRLVAFVISGGGCRLVDLLSCRGELGLRMVMEGGLMITWRMVEGTSC